MYLRGSYVLTMYMEGQAAAALPPAVVLPQELALPEVVQEYSAGPAMAPNSHALPATVFNSHCDLQISTPFLCLNPLPRLIRKKLIVSA